MIPIGDDAPVARFPLITILLIVVNVFVFFFELSLGPELQRFISIFGVTPKILWQWLATGNYAAAAVVLLSSMFLHGGWLHLGGNMLYLWIFGDNVEDLLGHFRFLGFYLLSGLAAMLAHAYFLPDSTAPAIGASGAIAGVLGAYLLNFPGARVYVLLPLFIFFPVITIPAFFMLGFWFLQQLFNGLIAVAEPGFTQVAWWAHIGGFMAGMVLVKLMAKRKKALF